MKMDEAFNPVAVRLLGANAVVLAPNRVPHLVEEARGTGWRLIQLSLALVGMFGCSVLILGGFVELGVSDKWMSVCFARGLGSFRRGA
jgi:hypothetical protein